MEDGVTIAESLLHLEEEEDDDEKVNLRESGEDRPSGSLLNHIFSNLVSRGEADHEEKGGKEENGENRGGLLDNIISNLVSPSSKKEQHEVSQARDGGGAAEDQAQKKQKVTVVDEESEKVKAEEEGGAGIIDHIVSHFLTSLPDDAAPTTDEATILIHSIIHD
ncbi:uncharacterized protein LOC7460393 [Populus trichocarpa]|uniref:uncharacterized protein LOC7460393 n=1 Tax=Populus trichocarpa TaxID=3694 RepID=UPI002278580A|nr:uncharacterized protein LOC7460393 [Populus trichocarpa]